MRPKMVMDIHIPTLEIPKEGEQGRVYPSFEEARIHAITELTVGVLQKLEIGVEVRR